jgi:hypothetical protein
MTFHLYFHLSITCIRTYVRTQPMNNRLLNIQSTSENALPYILWRLEDFDPQVTAPSLL